MLAGSQTKNSPPPGEATKSNTSAVLFLVMLLIQAAVFVYLIAYNRFFIRADGFDFYTAKYYFLNHAVMYGESPVWLPQMVHGVIGNLFYYSQASMMQRVFMLIGPLLSGINFLPLAHLAVYFDELILCIGTWLLAKEFFRSPYTVFYVTLSVVGSCIFMPQPWFNLYLFYAIPLILYWVHVFLRTQKWRYFCLAGLLLATQAVGNSFYFISLASLTVFLYVVSYCAFNWPTVSGQLSKIRLGPQSVLSIVPMALAMAAIFLLLSWTREQLVFYPDPDLRNTDGTIALSEYLKHVSLINRKNLVDLVAGLPFYYDYTVYFGVGGFLMTLLAFGRMFDRTRAHFFFLTAVLLLFCSGTIVTRLFYKIWPLMQYYQNIDKSAPIIKLFLCFISGIGFEWLFCSPNERNKTLTRVAVALALLGACIYFILVGNGSWPNSVYGATDLGYDALYPRLIICAVLVLTAALCLGARAIRVGKWHRIGLLLFILLQVVDLGTFKFWQLSKNSQTIAQDGLKELEFQEMPYYSRRRGRLWRDSRYAERLRPFGGHIIALAREHVVLYATLHLFAFYDDLDSNYRTDFWLKPFDNLWRTYNRFRVDQHDDRPAALPRLPLGVVIPRDHPSSLKVTGYSKDKIQFFTRAFRIGSNQELTRVLLNKNYAGDLLLISHPPEEGPIPERPKVRLANSDRLKFDYTVDHFDANRIEISVDVGERPGVWLYYADIWHKNWTASVNQKSRTVYRANMAYKAIQLEPGNNSIVFRYDGKATHLFHGFFSMLSLFWIAIIAWLVGNELRPIGVSKTKDKHSHATL